MTQQYKPGDKLEALVNNTWVHEGRTYVGQMESGKVVFEMERSVFARDPGQVRKMRVERQGWALRNQATNRLDHYIYSTKEEAEKHTIGQWEVVEITWKE